jgi:hypothetical protein
MLRLNVGCGQTPTPGWKNYDNSLSVRLAPHPATTALLTRLKILNEHEEFIAAARQAGITWADVAVRIPEADHSVDVIYSSHFVEHLDRGEILQFLKESRRVLVAGGTIRTALPNIRFHVDNYLQDGDADAFIQATRLTHVRSKTLRQKLRFLLIGDRDHLWMYDGDSFCRLLTTVGFKNARVLEPGRTSINEPGELNLRERVPESVFVEAVSA